MDNNLNNNENFNLDVNNSQMLNSNNLQNLNSNVETNATNQNIDTLGISNSNLNQPVNDVSNNNVISTGESLQSNNLQNSPQNLIQNNTQNLNNKSRSKKGIIIIILSIVLVIIIVLVCFKFIFKKSDNLDTSTDFYIDSPIPVKSNDKYGYINSKGKIVIDAKYQYAQDFIGDYALVVMEANITKVIDKEGNELFTTDKINGIEYIEENNQWLINGILYDKKLNKLSDDECLIDTSAIIDDNEYYSCSSADDLYSGLVSKTGKITYKYNKSSSSSTLIYGYEESNDKLGNKYCYVAVDKQYGIINCDTGKIIYDFSLNKIRAKGDNSFDISDESNNFLKTIYIQDDKIIYESTSNKVSIEYSEDYNSIVVRDNNKDYKERNSYINIQTGEVSSQTPSYVTKKEETWEDYTGLIKFCENSKCGLKNGDTIILNNNWDSISYLDLPLYKYLESIGKKYVIGVNEGNSNFTKDLIDLDTGKIVNTFNTSYISFSDDTTFIHYDDNITHDKIYYNLLTNKSIALSGDVYLYSNYLYEKNNNEKIYYNIYLEKIFTGEV